MTIRKRFFLIPFVAIALAFVWNTAVLIHKDWRAGYSTRDIYISPVNWPLYNLEIAARKFWLNLTDDGSIGLPQVKLYIPARSTAALEADIPDSTKVYRQAYILQPDDSLERVKIRYRGDNPINWLFSKKSMRIKLRKSRMREGIRVFNYRAAQTPALIGEYIALEVARRIGIFAPNSRAIEMYFNDKSRGVMVETERYDESFLRNRRVMPVNIYKGEQYNADLVPGTSRMLFENAQFWTRTARYNAWPKTDHRDLAKFISRLSGAESDSIAFDQFLEAIDMRQWAEFAIYQTLTQSTHNDDVHNMRLLSDIWRGKVTALPYDNNAQFNAIDTSAREPFLDAGPNEVLRLLHQSSDFLETKYRILQSLLLEQRIFETLRKDLQSLRAKFLISAARDVDRIYLHYYSGIPRSKLRMEKLAAKFDDGLRHMAELQEWIVSKLHRLPSIGWEIHGERLSLTVDALVPSGQIEIEATLPRKPGPIRLRWDRDRHLYSNADDPLVPAQYDGSVISIDMTLIANRIPKYSWQENKIVHTGFSIQPTRFDFQLPQGTVVHTVRAHNPYTGEPVSARQERSLGYPPVVQNRPLFPIDAPSSVTWSGDIHIDQDRIIRHPVVLAPGTRLHMAKGASLIFRSKVLAMGTPEHPIRVTGAAAGASQAWGVFALQGNGTTGSRLRHVFIDQGSNDEVDAIVYTGMLSIHDTSDIEISDVRLGKNYQSDDSLHLVYANGVRIKNISIDEANGDGIDIDVSEVTIDGGRVARSGNDGIDLMSSDVTISGTHIVESGDKGISVGERSRTLVWNVLLASNKIGVESKDDSRAVIMHSNLISNEIQLNAYKKNWRYGTGGRIDAHMVRFTGKENIISTKGKSDIVLYSSELTPLPIKQDKHLHMRLDPLPRAQLRDLLSSFPSSGQAATTQLPFDIGQIGKLRVRRENRR